MSPGGHIPARGARGAQIPAVAPRAVRRPGGYLTGRQVREEDGDADGDVRANRRGSRAGARTLRDERRAVPRDASDKGKVRPREARDQTRGDDPSLRSLRARGSRPTQGGSLRRVLQDAPEFMRGVRRLLRSEVLRRRLPRERRRPRRRVFHGSNERGNRRGPARRAHVPAIDPQTANGSHAIRRGHGRASMREKITVAGGDETGLRGASRGGIGPVGGGGHAGQNAGELARRGGLEAAAVGHGDIPRGFHV